MPLSRKKSQLLLVLSGIFVVNALLAEIIGVKIFSLEALLGIPGTGLRVFGSDPMDFNLTADVIIWPVVFVTTDLINEYFGKRGVVRVSWLTAGLLVYAFLVITAVTAVPPAQFWLDMYRKESVNIDQVFALLFRQGNGIIVGSLVAFLLGQLIDATIFAWLRRLTAGRLVWLRATGSTVVSQLVDSFVVLLIAFHFFAPEPLRWPLKLVLQVATINYIYKLFAAIALTPVIYLAHWLIDRYLGDEAAQQLETQAAHDQSF